MADACSALFASIRERLQFGEYPKPLKAPHWLVTAAALLAMSFMGFSGLKFFDLT